MSDWVSTTKNGIIELRNTFKSSGARFSQVLVRIDIDGIPSKWSGSQEKLADPELVISMNGQAGMTVGDWSKMTEEVNLQITNAIRLWAAKHLE